MNERYEEKQQIEKLSEQEKILLNENMLLKKCIVDYVRTTSTKIAQLNFDSEEQTKMIKSLEQSAE
jgi:hypothetical protein